jgi:hypothetical protein
MARKTFPYPLRLEDLGEFTHRAAGHELGRAFHKDGMAYAGNGYLAIRCHRGMWMASDFEPAKPEADERICSLPWHRFETFPQQWVELSTITGTIFRYAPVGVWDKRNRISPSPVWRIAENYLVRLSLLQLIALLPKCEVFTGPTDRNAHMPFRFSGGIGFIAYDDRLTIASKEILNPQRCPLDGHVLDRSPRPTFKMFKDWPPAEPIDD